MRIYEVTVKVRLTARNASEAENIVENAIYESLFGDEIAEVVYRESQAAEDEPEWWGT